MLVILLTHQHNNPLMLFHLLARAHKIHSFHYYLHCSSDKLKKTIDPLELYQQTWLQYTSMVLKIYDLLIYNQFDFQFVVQNSQSNFRAQIGRAHV